MGRNLTHEEFIEKLLLKNKHYANGEFDVVEQYIASDINIMCCCKKDNGIWYPKPRDLLRGRACPYCAGNKILIGYNDMWTTRPDIAAMLQDPNDGYRYTYSSIKKAWFVCPDCKTPSEKRINNVVFHAFGCPYCSDGISYPNKLARAFLYQLNVINHQCEYSPSWLKPYRFDNYFEYNNQKYVLEMDGELGHGNKKFGSKEKDVEKIKIDIFKDSLAKEHNINVIRINCTKSDIGYIKNNIYHSILSEIFDLSIIDWDLCDKIAQKNIIKEVCNFYMQNKCTLIKVGNQFNIHPDTIGKYLKKGQTFGWCDYTIDVGRKRSQLHRMKPVIVFNNENNVIHSFDGISICSVEMTRIYNKQFKFSSVSNACKTHKPYKGYYFRFADELEQSNESKNNQ